MKVVTVASNIHHPLLIKYLNASCQFYGIDLEVLTYQKSWTGNRVKDRIIKNYLKKLDADETILCIDAYDTLFLSNTEEIEKRFLECDTQILFSAEQNCWPVPALEAYYKGSEEYRYLNGGAFIGSSKAILELMNAYSQPPVESFDVIKDMKVGGMSINEYCQWSSQYYWSLLYLKHQDIISIDSECAIFYTMGTELNLFRSQFEDFQKNKMESEVYKSELLRVRNGLSQMNSLEREDRPLHLHFNGPIVQAIFQNEDLSNYFDF